ncbi:hypothetical protein Y032_0026g1449 [Ancylostoma ceylanicum]|uniref:Uncharacterized protein n=1 Tax=Ancylostoma ceylanicum TaxID=53326 RepID=A0A016UWR6_9BILA|nr:hypothetical protein Y032_0026g1449 [Ancylostoma ceylanicum]
MNADASRIVPQNQDSVTDTKKEDSAVYQLSAFNVHIGPSYHVENGETLPKGADGETDANASLRSHRVSVLTRVLTMGETVFTRQH